MPMLPLISVDQEVHTYHLGPIEYGYSINHDWDSPMEYLALFLYVCISAMFIAHLWRANPSESASVKAFWTVILLIPLIGWLAYMSFGPVPTSRTND
jgi:hypothetical protein